MNWPKKPKQIDLSGLDLSFAGPKLNLDSLGPHGLSLAWDRPINVELSKIDQGNAWNRLGDKAWDILTRRRMNLIFPGELPCEFKRYLDTLRRSSRRYRSEVFIGLRQPGNVPVFVPRHILERHAYILGGTGSGKTSHALAQLLIQLAEAYTEPGGKHHPAPPILIMDLKQNGDRYLRALAERIAEARGQKLQFFSIDPDYQGLQFDLDYCLRKIDYPLKKVELLLKALSMTYPEGYGSDFFTHEQRDQLKDTVYHDRPKTTKELIACIRHATRGKSGNTDARGLYSALSSLEVAKNIHIDGSRIGRDQIIDFDRFFDEGEVLYVHLDSRSLSLLSRDVGKLLLFCLLETASQRAKDGKLQQCFVAVDEFHRLAARNVVEMLEDARSAGVAFLLAHQSSSSLKTRDADLYGQVFENCSFKQCLTLEDERVIELFRMIAGRVAEWRRGFSRSTTETSGETLGFNTSQSDMRNSSQTSGWSGTGPSSSESKGDAHGSASGSSSSFSKSHGDTEGRSLTEEMECALTPEMVMAVNNINLLSLVHVKGAGPDCVTPTGGEPILVQGLYPFTEDEAKEMTHAPWPRHPPRDPQWYYSEVRPRLPKAALDDEDFQPNQDRNSVPSGSRPPKPPSGPPPNEGEQRRLENIVRLLADEFAHEMIEEPMSVQRFSRAYSIAVKTLMEMSAKVGIELHTPDDMISSGKVRRLKRLIAERGDAT